jgi:hypothetical protein
MSQSNAMTNQRFIVSPGFDWIFVLGGAALTLALPVVVTAQPGLLPWVFWAWIVFFEGSHFWATLSRTYLDKKFSQENRSVLFGSLIFFVLPAIAVAHWKAVGSNLLVDLYGFGIFVWSLYHNARQHFGFFKIYSKKSAQSDPNSVGSSRWLYAGIVAPQFYFLMFHKGPAALGFFPSRASLGAGAGVIEAACWLISGMVGVYLIRQAIGSIKKGLGMPLVYSLVCWVFYSTMFYFVAPREPFYSMAQNGAQGLMLLAVMNSLFHNIQYHAIVWAYARKRYGEAREQSADLSVLGIASRVNGTLGSYLLVSVLMGFGFAWIVSGLGDWPTVTGHFTPTPMSPLSYILFFGIIGHHFFLDQKIWRPSRQSELRSYLGVSS